MQPRQAGHYHRSFNGNRNSGNSGNSGNGNGNSNSQFSMTGGAYETGRISTLARHGFGPSQAQMESERAGNSQTRSASGSARSTLRESYPSTRFGDQMGRGRAKATHESKQSEFSCNYARDGSVSNDLAREEKHNMDWEASETSQESDTSEMPENIQTRLKVMILDMFDDAMKNKTTSNCKAYLFDADSSKMVAIETKAAEPEKLIFLARQACMNAVGGNAVPTGYFVEIFKDSCVEPTVLFEHPRLQWLRWAAQTNQMQHFYFNMMSVRNNRIPGKTKAQSDESASLAIARTNEDKQWLWLYRNSDVFYKYLVEYGIVSSLQCNGIVSFAEVQRCVRQAYGITFDIDHYWLAARLLATLNDASHRMNVCIIDCYPEGKFESERVVVNLQNKTMLYMFEAGRLNFDLRHSLQNSFEKAVCEQFRSVVEPYYLAAFRANLRDVSLEFLLKILCFDCVPELAQGRWLMPEIDGSRVRPTITLDANSSKDLKDVSCVLDYMRSNLPHVAYQTVKFREISDDRGRPGLNVYIHKNAVSSQFVNELLTIWRNKLQKIESCDLNMANFG